MGLAFRLGITGGIGSGKSTVAQQLRQLGAAVLDADAISRELTAPEGLAMAAILATFGTPYLTPEGALDREKMRQLAFADPTARQRLEAIIHPLVAQETWCRARLAEQIGHPCLVFDIPLLAESASWRGQLDWVLVVDCRVETQIARVMARNQLERAAVQAVMAAQVSRQRRLSCADAVIFNDTSCLEDLALQVSQLAPRFGLSLRPETRLIEP
jgi:dephospho-CoA kinase